MTEQPKVVVKNVDLQGYLSQLQDITAEVKNIFETLSEEQLVWKSNPNEWNTIECFEHLFMTGNLYYPKIKEAIQTAQQKGLRKTNPLKLGGFARLFAYSIGPNAPFKVKTIPIFEPQTLTDVSVGERFVGQQEELASLIQEADGLDLNGVKLPSPATNLLKFTIGESIYLQIVHQQTHLRQAKALQGLVGFPEHKAM